MGLAEAGICCAPVVMVGSMLGCSVVVPAGGRAVSGLLPTCNRHGFFPKCFDLTHVEELEAGGDADVKSDLYRGFFLYLCFSTSYFALLIMRSFRGYRSMVLSMVSL